MRSLLSLDGPCQPWGERLDPTYHPKLPNWGSSPAHLLTACWTCSEKDTLYSTGVFHDSFCCEKPGETGAILSLIDLRCLKYSSPFGNYGRFSSLECLTVCPGIALTSPHESEHWANRALPRVGSEAPCLCESATHRGRARWGHLGTWGVRCNFEQYPSSVACCSVRQSSGSSLSLQGVLPPPWAQSIQGEDSVSVTHLPPGEWIPCLARLEEQSSRYWLLVTLPSWESCLHGETEAQWNQETRDEMEVLSFAYYMTFRRSVCPSLGWSCPVCQVRNLGLMGPSPPAQSLLICEYGIQATHICAQLHSAPAGQSIDFASGLEPPWSSCLKAGMSGDFREWMGAGSSDLGMVPSREVHQFLIGDLHMNFVWWDAPLCWQLVSSKQPGVSSAASGRSSSSGELGCGGFF